MSSTPTPPQKSPGCLRDIWRGTVRLAHRQRGRTRAVAPAAGVDVQAGGVGSRLDPRCGPPNRRQPGQAHVPGVAHRGQRRAGGGRAGSSGSGRCDRRRRPRRGVVVPVTRRPPREAGVRGRRGEHLAAADCRSNYPTTRRGCGCSPAAPKSASAEEIAANPRSCFGAAACGRARAGGRVSPASASATTAAPAVAPAPRRPAVTPPMRTTPPAARRSPARHATACTLCLIGLGPARRRAGGGAAGEHLARARIVHRAHADPHAVEICRRRTGAVAVDRTARGAASLGGPCGCAGHGAGT